jgi:hypothetical protein
MPVKFFNINDLVRADNDMQGFCLSCGHCQDGCEPDARKYTCEECDKPRVYGAAEIAMMGLVLNS